MFKNGMRPVQPGEVLQEDFLKPLGMSANAFAKALNVPTPRINNVVLKRRGVSVDTAMRLARYFGGGCAFECVPRKCDLYVTPYVTFHTEFSNRTEHRRCSITRSTLSCWLPYVVYSSSHSCSPLLCCRLSGSLPPHAQCHLLPAPYRPRQPSASSTRFTWRHSICMDQ